MARRFSRSNFALPVAVFLVVGAVLPLLVLFMFSVFTVEDLDLIPDFNLASWRELFTNPTYGILIGKALMSGLAAAIGTAIIGYPVAVGMARLPPVWKGVALTILMTPLYVGELVRLYAWRLVLGTEGLLNSLLKSIGLIEQPLKILLFSPLSTALVLVYNNLPFMVLAIWISVELVDRRLIEAARDLGARPIEAFFSVILPLTTPGLAAGSFAVFALAAGDLLTPSLLGGTSGSTAMAMVDSLFGTAFDWPTASVLALALLFALILTAVILAKIVLSSRGARAALSGGLR
jgi:spermidine/putrescine transport system permease protein